MFTRNRSQKTITATIAIFFVASMFYAVSAAYNGECWVINAQTKQVVKIKTDYTIDPNAITLAQPQAIAINGKDGSVWIADTAAGAVFKILDGNVAGPIEGIDGPASISVNPTDGTAWVGGNNGIAKISADCKTILKKISGLKEACVSVNYKDGSVWATDSSGRALKYDASGAQIAQASVKLIEPKYVAVNPTDGTAWIADSRTANLLIKVDANGNELLKVTDIQFPASPSVNPKTGNCWVSSITGRQVIKLNAKGQKLASVSGFMTPLSVVTDPKDDGVWIADQVMGQVTKLNAKGNIVKQIAGFALPSVVALGYWAK